MTITSTLTPTQKTQHPVDRASPRVETTPGNIDVSWAEKALLQGGQSTTAALQRAAPRRRWLTLLVAAIVLCACSAIAAVGNTASPTSFGQGSRHRATSVVHRVSKPIEPAHMSSSTLLSCPSMLISPSGTHGFPANSLDPLWCTDTWPALLRISAPTRTRAPQLRRAR